MTPGCFAAASRSRVITAGAIWYPLAGLAGSVPFVGNTVALTARWTTLASLGPEARMRAEATAAAALRVTDSCRTQGRMGG